MSSHSIRTHQWSANPTRIDIYKPTTAEITKKSFFRSPKTMQEKLLCYSLCLLFIIMMVFLAALCIISERWKASLSKLTVFYLNEDVVCETEACKETAQNLLSNIDPSTDPCMDFYQYACGEWMKKHPIREGRQVIMTYDIRRKEVSDAVVELLENISSEVETPRSVGALGRFYRGCQDKETRDKRGVEPLLKLIKDLDGWPMLEGSNWNAKEYSWYKQVAKCNRKLSLDCIVKISLLPSVDIHNKIYSPVLERGVYLFEKYYNEVLESPTSDTSEGLIDTIVKAAIMLGSKMKTEELREEARKLVIFEYGLSIRGVDSKDKTFRGNLQKLDEVAMLNLVKKSNFTYKELLNLHLQSDPLVTDETFIFARSFKYFAELPSYIEGVDPRIVANYIMYRIVYTMSRYASEEIWTLRYNNKIVWDERTGCRLLTEMFMEHVLDRLFIDKFFSPLTRYHVKKMVEMIRLAYSSSFDQKLWMDKRTMLNAIIKLQNMASTIGHTEWIADDQLLDEYYKKALDIKENEYFEVLLQLSQVKADARFSKWNKTVSRKDEVKSEAATVNAFYMPLMNAMTIPAGILGYPFYKFGRIDSINYGALGAIIGHEISHGFDSSGRHFDHHGNFRNWWTSATLQKFNLKTRCFVKQYESYDLDPEIKANGHTTLGENIADNGGIRNAFKAFRLHLALSDEDMTHRKTLPGLPATPEQLFFLGYASIWCANGTKEHLKSMVEKHKHSPNKLRVNIPLSNFKEFARAYKCHPGTPMNPRHKCVLW